MLSSIHVVNILIIVCVLTVESNYNVFTYDDGTGDDEHCCLVQLGEKFCLAKPLTRSLVQVNKDCQRFSVDDKTKHYLNKVVRRLNVETSNKVGDKILIELEKPLEKEILKDDLLCLATANNNINLEKCHIILPNVQPKKHKRKADNETAEESVEEEKAEDGNKIRRLEVSEPLRIHQGHGLSVHQPHELEITDAEATTRQQRESWSWYRSHTKNICNQPLKYRKNCISLNNQNGKYLERIIYKSTTTNDEEQDSQPTYFVTKGSKLYCEDNNQHTKLLGYYRHSEICFLLNNQIYIEHKFTDFVSLSDTKQNRDILQFISNNTKLRNEFEHDCNDKTTLDDIVKASEAEAEDETAETDDNSST